MPPSLHGTRPLALGAVLAGALVAGAAPAQAQEVAAPEAFAQNAPVEPPAPPAETAPAAGAASSSVSATEDPVPNPLEPRVRELEDTVRKLQETIQQLQSQPKPAVDQARVEKVVDDKLDAQKPLTGFANQGFFINSADGNFQLRLRGLLHADARAFASGSGRTGIDSFFLRRARPILEGTLYKYLDFRFTPDFAEGRAQIQDAYLDFEYWKEARLRVGKFKTPLSLERLQSASDMRFIERSIANNLAPNRDIGVQVGGELAKGILEYQLAALNGVADGGSGDADTGNGKDFAGRVFAQPFRNSKGHALQGLGVGIAATIGDRDDALSANYRTAGRSSFFRFSGASGATPAATGDGNQVRWAPQLYYFRGPFGLLGEYLTSSVDVVRGASRGEVRNKGWFAQATYVITGEENGFRGVTPKKPFDPKKGQWGAFEVGLRYSRVDVDDDAFSRGFASAASSASRAAAWTLGLNWYLNRNLKLQLNYERTDFNRSLLFGSDSRDHEDVFLSRFQLAF
jgi:phosphate-selective porin OprO/OprP